MCSFLDPKLTRLSPSDNNLLFSAEVHLGHHKTIRRVANLAPCQFRQRMAGEKRNRNRSKLDADTDSGSACGQIAWNQKLIVAGAAVGALYDVLREAEFIFGVGID